MNITATRQSYGDENALRCRHVRSPSWWFCFTLQNHQSGLVFWQVPLAHRGRCQRSLRALICIHIRVASVDFSSHSDWCVEVAGKLKAKRDERDNSQNLCEYINPDSPSTIGKKNGSNWTNFWPVVFIRGIVAATSFHWKWRILITWLDSCCLSVWPSCLSWWMIRRGNN